jgi:uncharacterized radical SAM superfamily Fe-S cluster-containing enzyme
MQVKAIALTSLLSNTRISAGDCPVFRISQYMQELLSTARLARTQSRNPPAPVVIWNLIRRCNLTCKHCYSISTDRDFPGELTSDEIFAVIDDLKRFRVPVLILSGGEPLLRPDIFRLLLAAPRRWASTSAYRRTAP